jgi:hypothetical protein
MRHYFGDLLLFAGSIASCAALVSGCGIYTVEVALNPPFGISMSSVQLKFRGENAEPEFSGYILWFKEREEDPFRVVQYNGDLTRPTIPVVPFEALPGITLVSVGAGIVEYTVDIAYMEHPDSNKSFLDLKDEGGVFFFGVSTAGTGGLESEKVEFGQWPP